MWGCIAIRAKKFPGFDVPSLYVRVYRGYWCNFWRLQSSLIICEGVSQLDNCAGSAAELPHYMWGCIDVKSEEEQYEVVPSLYVRVYRTLDECEPYVEKFPHCMGGCIKNTKNKTQNLRVSSSCVRAYRENKTFFCKFLTFAISSASIKTQSFCVFFFAFLFSKNPAY